MNGTQTRLAVLIAVSALALMACGGASRESPVGPGGDAATFSAANKSGPEASVGDGVCDGCDGTGDGPGPGDGTCDGCDCTCDGGVCTCECPCDGCNCTCEGSLCLCECACDGTGPHGPGSDNVQGP